MQTFVIVVASLSTLSHICFGFTELAYSSLATVRRIALSWLGLAAVVWLAVSALAALLAGGVVLW